MGIEVEFYKLVCVDDNNPFEYAVLEDVNCADINKVHDFIIHNIHKHRRAKWMLIPCTCAVN